MKIQFEPSASQGAIRLQPGTRRRQATGGRLERNGPGQATFLSRRVDGQSLGPARWDPASPLRSVLSDGVPLPVHVTLAVPPTCTIHRRWQLAWASRDALSAASVRTWQKSTAAFSANRILTVVVRKGGVEPPRPL